MSNEKFACFDAERDTDKCVSFGIIANRNNNFTPQNFEEKIIVY